MIIILRFLKHPVVREIALALLAIATNEAMKAKKKEPVDP